MKIRPRPLPVDEVMIPTPRFTARSRLPTHPAPRGISCHPRRTRTSLAILASIVKDQPVKASNPVLAAPLCGFHLMINGSAHFRRLSSTAAGLGQPGAGSRWSARERVCGLAPHRWMWEWFPGYLTPLWFLGVYGLLIAAVPVTATLH